MPQITFYYESSCPACVHYITSMKKLDKERKVKWYDFHEGMDDLGISYEEAVKQPLAKDKDGKLLKGMDAILLLWAELSYLKLTIPALRNALVKPIFTLYYQTFAEWRPKKHSCYRRHGCQDI